MKLPIAAVPANPANYAELVSMDPQTEYALIECVTAATGIPGDDLDSDDWLLGLLVDRLHDDYTFLYRLATAAYHLARTLPASRVWTVEEAELAAAAADYVDHRGYPPYTAPRRAPDPPPAPDGRASGHR